MNKEDIIRKLTSRKLWAAVISVVISLCVIFGIDDLKTEQIVALVSAVGALVAYIFGEGIVDAVRLKSVAKKDPEDESTSLSDTR